MGNSVRREAIDAATPQSARTWRSSNDEEYELVFSDEFEVDGRTLYPGMYVLFGSFLYESFLSRFAGDDDVWKSTDENSAGQQLMTRAGNLEIPARSNVTHLELRSTIALFDSSIASCAGGSHLDVSMSLPDRSSHVRNVFSLCFLNA